MPVNGTDFINNPWVTTFSPFTDLFGTGFYLIPISFIAIALFIKTRNPVLVSAYMIASGMLFGSGNIFVGFPEMSLVYYLFAGLGLVGLVVSLFFMRK